MWGWGRPRRNVPRVNYNENKSSEDEFDSPLQSPDRPVNTRQGSPVELAVPHLNDNVDEELNQVQQTLRNIGHTHTFRSTTPFINGEAVESGAGAVGEEAEVGGESEVGTESVVEGHIVETPNNNKVLADNSEESEADDSAAVEEQVAVMVNIDSENVDDGEKAPEHARAIKVEFDANDIKFWFVQLEDEMTMASVKSQCLKKTVLQRNLPLKQKEDVKELLSTPKEGAGLIYKKIKTELLRIYAQKPCDTYRKALTRTMVGLPSQLGYQIVNDICKKATKLDGCCCAAAAEALWTIQLPVAVRNHISDKEFTAQTYKEVFETADKVYLSGKQVSIAAMGVSRVSLDETLPAFSNQNQPQAEVAAFKSNPGNKNNKNNSSGSNKGGKNNKGKGQKNKPPRKRHASSPPESCCDRHYTHGADAWYCLSPLTCPWVNKCSPRP